MKTISDIRRIMRERTGSDELFKEAFSGCSRIGGVRREMARVIADEAREHFRVVTQETDTTTAISVIANKYDRSRRWVYDVIERIPMNA